MVCIATHFHEDRTAALDFFRSRKVATYTTRLTDSFSLRRGNPRAEFLFDKDTTFNVDGYSFRAPGVEGCKIDAAYT